MQGHFSAVTDLSLAPDNWTLLSASRDKVVMLWDLRTFQQLATIPAYEVLEGVPPTGFRIQGLAGSKSCFGGHVGGVMFLQVCLETAADPGRCLFALQGFSDCLPATMCRD